MDYYDIHGDQPVLVIMVLPILGGSNGISSAFARFFARNGYAVLLVYRQKKYKELEHLDYLNDILAQIVFDHMQAIDWLETQPDIDVSRIGRVANSKRGWVTLKPSISFQATTHRYSIGFMSRKKR